MSQLAHLSLFALDRISGLPIPRFPFYAEVGTPAAVEPQPVVIDQRFQDAIIAALGQADVACSQNAACRSRVLTAASESLSRLFTSEVRDKLAADANAARNLLTRALAIARTAAGGALGGLTPDELKLQLDAGLRKAAQEQQIPLAEARNDAKPVVWTYPLGVLATDHVGYLSFDLSRLSQPVWKAVVADVQARKLDPAAVLKTTVRLYPLVAGAQPIEALNQARFADDAIVVRAELDDPNLPAIVKNLGILAMQNPDLSDWRLSPASFATNPGTLVGQDGCESLLPANVALQEFFFYDVVRLNDAQVGIPGDLSTTVKPGIIHEYRVAWYPLGHSLGQILYSLPLAPGESVNLAVIDWTRRDDAQRAEHTTMDEQLVHNEHRDRTITETVNAAIQEYQKGSSFMAGLAASVGVGAALGAGAGLAAGLAGSLGGSTANSSGSRNIAANTVQNVSDNITQASASKRELQSTVVVHSVQAEKEAIETRTVVNYNHSHALTILYYEVLRHFRVVTERIRTKPALLQQQEVKPFAFDFDQLLPDGRKIHIHTYSPFFSVNRALLRAGLLDQKYVAGFEAFGRIEQRDRSAKHAPAPPAVPDPGDAGFIYFTIIVHTGGIADYGVSLYGALFDQGLQQIATLSSTSTTTHNGLPIDLTDAGAFQGQNKDYTFFACTDDKKPRQWRDIHAIRIGFPGVDKDRHFSFQAITVWGSDLNGRSEKLVDWRNFDSILTANYDFMLETTHPAPTPAVVPSADEINDLALLDELLDHLDHHMEYYNRLVWLNEDPLARATRLDGVKWDASSHLLDHLENRAVEIIGSWVAFPTNDPKIDLVIQGIDNAGGENQIEPVSVLNERLVTLPTRGVFAEAKLGHCNASEEIDNTRFWDWQTSPIPHWAPEIAPATPVTPQPQQPNLQPTPFPQSLVNIVNPPAAPDPTGLAAALNVLGTPNIFRDMSGQAAVADLLKKLSDNSISIAQAANQARSIRSTYGSPSAGGGSGSGGANSSGGFGARATPTQPSAATRDLQDYRSELNQGVNDGMISRGQANSAYSNAANRLGSGQPLLAFKVDAGGTPEEPAFPDRYDEALTDNMALQEALDKARSGLPAAQAAKLDSVAISIVDVGSGAFPHGAAGHHDSEEYFSGSLVKMAAVFAAFELRAAARNVASKGQFPTVPAFFENLRSEFNSQIKGSLPLPILRAAGITDVHVMPTYEKVLSASSGADGSLTVNFEPTFATNVSRIVQDQGQNVAVHDCIHHLGYGYMNCALEAGGFFHAGSSTGIWLAGDYSGGKDWPYVRIPCINDVDTASGTTTAQLAKLFTLLVDDKLFVERDQFGGRVRSGSGDMLNIMPVGSQSWFQMDKPTDIWPTTGPLKVLQAKVGEGPLKTGAMVFSEAAIVRFQDASHNAEFVIVWQNVKDASDLQSVASMIEKTIRGYLGA
jgi:hypothetical protein